MACPVFRISSSLTELIRYSTAAGPSPTKIPLLMQSTDSARTRTYKIAASALAAVTAVVFSMTFAQAANSAYNKAVADYTSGKYALAASEFESLKAAYPTNALIRYYLGLTRQALGHFDKARSEYQWVATNGDARLKAMALQGLKAMGGTKSYVASSTAKGSTPMAGDYIPPFGSSGSNSGSGSSGYAGSGSNSSSTSSSTSSPNSSGTNQTRSRVTKILEFTAPWCSTCQNFAPTYAAVKSQWRDIAFEEIDFDSSTELKAKYNVSQTPHLVFLDSSGKVLFSRAGAPHNAEVFNRLIRNYR
ncbi:MAG: hypothetical protein DKT66_13385 [Candidatus Melainabacteria bacterium]|nr:MAG: hypothetical protein DKT66_13385 [Candidatus Melainabacteria bacterium]